MRRMIISANILNSWSRTKEKPKLLSSYSSTEWEAIKIDDNFPYLEKFKELKAETQCSYPKNADEIAISDISAEILFHSTEYRLDSYDDFHKNDLKSVDDLIGKEYQGKKIVGIFSATNHELDEFLKNHSFLKVDGQDQNLSEKDKSFLNGEFLSGYVYVSKDCEEEKTNVVNGFVSFLYEIKGNIKEDMDFLNDIDKESLTDAPDTRISTSMSFKAKNKEVKIETTQKYNRFDTCYQTFLFVSFDILFVFLLWIYRKSWKQNATNIGTKIPQKLEAKCRKSWKQSVSIVIILTGGYIWNTK